MIVVAVCGLSNTGKNTIGDVLVRYGFRPLDYTKDVLAPLLEKEGKDIVRENLSALATSLRKQHGPAILTEILAKKIKKGKYVITGLRAKEEAEYLRKKFGRNFFLVGVVVDPEIRYRRAVERNIKGEGNLTKKQFLEKDQLPTERLIAETIARADFLIDNNGTEKELEGKVREILRGLKN